MLISKNLLLVQIQRNKKRNSRIINYFVPTTNYGTPELEAAVPGVSSYFNAICTIGEGSFVRLAGFGIESNSFEKTLFRIHVRNENKSQCA